MCEKGQSGKPRTIRESDYTELAEAVPIGEKASMIPQNVFLFCFFTRDLNISTSSPLKAV